MTSIDSFNKIIEPARFRIKPQQIEKQPCSENGPVIWNSISCQVEDVDHSKMDWSQEIKYNSPAWACQQPDNKRRQEDKLDKNKDIVELTRCFSCQESDQIICPTDRFMLQYRHDERRV